ncbi:acyltransferase family protein [Agreia sp. Leaf283]|uniref:acyltransferase family protein n=1 Tax=Agreia sp. Leaf283 TaxID=1736321 RepID=UPI0006F56CBE|nr:acyltransferase family protein [Agreia sp. Leaf283]KQP56391.1 hypothetical protein ASF51_00155 [Agreia sp. Leaf283]
MGGMAPAGRRAERRRVPSPAMRLDIQVLRAVAVGAVLFYHLWPNLFPGGFVGVDVFFVISGFLITSHLAKKIGTGSHKLLAGFWANRARRLLPLASVVLLATIGGIFAFMPESSWKVALRNIVGSAVYVQNWMLANDSVNYLARDQAPIPTQHFWTLSVEEQFYIAWPLILLGTALVVRRSLSGRRPLEQPRLVQRSITIIVVVILASSVVYSVWLTSTSPSIAYFSTPARVWEFASGGLLAILVASPALRGAHRALPRSMRIAFSWAGFLVLGGTILLLPVDTAFPGVAALLPVIGAVLMIWAGDLGRAFAPTLLARARVITYIGDISYGIYLWHWPLVVLVPLASGQPLGNVAKVAIIGASLALAAVSKVLVEDPFRYGQFWTFRIRRGFYPAIAGMAAVCVVCAGSLFFISATAPQAGDGALPALGAGTDVDAPLVPSIANRADDKAEMFDCFDFDGTGPHECTYGSDDAPVSLAIAGDSHAAHWIPALIDIVDQRGWKLTTFVGLNCEAGLSDACAGGRTGFDDIVANDYDLVLVAGSRRAAATQEATADYWGQLVDSGVPVVPIVDVPYNPASAFDCIDASGGETRAAMSCTTPLAAALDAVADQTMSTGLKLGLDPIDLTDVFCDSQVCNSVIDNIVVYQDSPASHLTTTFSHHISPILGEEIDKRIQG